MNDGSTRSTSAWVFHTQVHPVFGTFEQRSELRGRRGHTLVESDGGSISMNLSSFYARASKPGPMFPIRTTYNKVIWFEISAPTFDTTIKVVGSAGIARAWPIEG